jgi:serine phosphatase RsbU (regulator of sigma subunit)
MVKFIALQRIAFRLVTAVAVLTAIALVSVSLKWPYPSAAPEYWLAIIAKIVGDVDAWLIASLVFILCWRQPGNRSALDLSVFLASSGLATFLLTRLPSQNESGFLSLRAAAAVCMLVALLSWLRFCRGFPRQFNIRETPASEPGTPLPWLIKIGGTGESPFKEPEKVAAVSLWVHFVLFVLWFSGAFTGPFRRVGPFLYFFSIIGYGVSSLRRHYILGDAVERRKILWIAEGAILLIALTAVGLYAGLLLEAFLQGSFFQGSQLDVLFLLGVALGWLVFVTCLFIGIFKDGAFDSALVIKKTALLTILTAFILSAYLLLVGGIGNLLVRFTAVESQSVVILSTLAIAAVFMPVKNRIQALVDRRLFRKKYEYPQLIAAIKRELGSTGPIDARLDQAVVSLQKAMHNNSVVAFILSQQDQSMSAAARAGPGSGAEPISFGPLSGLARLTRPAYAMECDLSEQERLKIAGIGGVLLVPARWKEQTVGLLSIGKRLSDTGYDAEDAEFLSAVAEELAASVVQQRLQKEREDLEQAREIQAALLPKDIPILEGYEISGAWLPTRSVSGDYYDILPLAENKIAICIGDVCGKGMPAALLMANVQAAVRAVAGESVSPADLCQRVNRILCENVAEGRFVTFFYGVIYAKARRLVYTCAGHNPPLLVRADGTVTRLDKGGTVLGLFAAWQYESSEITFSTGDRLLLFTDGLTEAQSTTGEEFGEERLIRLLSSRPELSAKELQDTIVSSVSEFSSGNFHDDVTLLALQVMDSRQ